jgi:hypothetical protein
MEKKMNVSGKRFMVASMVVVILWTMVSIVSGVPVYDSINISSSTIEQGQPWMLNGSAPGYENVQVWIFGPDEILFLLQGVETDGSYTYSLPPKQARDMTPGKYHAVLQFPHEQGVYDIRVNDWQVINTKKPAAQQQIFSLVQSEVTPLSPFAYARLIQALDDPAVNDTYADITFSIISPHSTESAIIKLLIYIMSSTFMPSPKNPESMQEGTNGIVHVMGNDTGNNTGRSPVDTPHWLAHEYLMSPVAVNGNATTSTLSLNSGSIHIDPIDNNTVRDMITITGTSVLSENDPLNVQLLYPPHILTKEITGQPSCGGSGCHVTTINRTSQKNGSYGLNTSGCSPGTGIVEALSRSSLIGRDARQFEIYPDTNANSRPTPGIFLTNPDETPQSSPPRPAPLPPKISFAVRGLCAGASTFFRGVI